MSKLRVLDLFSGIGGFSLGLERTGGFETVAFCEINAFCRKVLAQHWPEVVQYTDVRTLSADQLRADGIAVDVVCGGFPCQDISTAGEQAGIDGERSGLWSELARIIGETRPLYVIVENVANLLAGPSEQPGRWFGRVLADLAALGYDAEWHCIPASAIDAPHQRDRVWIVAYPTDALRRADTRSVVAGEGQGGREAQGWRVQEGLRLARDDGPTARGEDVANAYCLAPVGSAIARQERPTWHPEPALGRVVDGLSYGLVRDELSALGNAVVPQIPELIGRAILATTPQGRAA